MVAEVFKPGMYKLAYEKGTVFTNAWNVEHLRHFYRASRLYVFMHILYRPCE